MKSTISYQVFEREHCTKMVVWGTHNKSWLKWPLQSKLKSVIVNVANIHSLCHWNFSVNYVSSDVSSPKWTCSSVVVIVIVQINKFGHVQGNKGEISFFFAHNGFFYALGYIEQEIKFDYFLCLTLEYLLTVLI